MTETKHFLYSKTLWFNALIAALAVLADHSDLLRSYLSDGSYLALMMAVSVINIYLRIVTTTGVRRAK